LIVVNPIPSSTHGLVVVFLRGTDWAFSGAGREKHEASPGHHFFDMVEPEEYVQEVRYKQDTHALQAVQFVTSTGRASPVYTSMAAYREVPTHRYVAPPERGEIIGLVRAKSAIIRGTIILGILHLSLDHIKETDPRSLIMQFIRSARPTSMLLFAIPEQTKRSCLARTCFCLNVLCCAQTCAGEKVTSELPCCPIMGRSHNQGTIANIMGIVSCLTRIPRCLVGIPAFCCFSTFANQPFSPPSILVRGCGLSDRCDSL